MLLQRFIACFCVFVWTRLFLNEEGKIPLYVLSGSVFWVSFHTWASSTNVYSSMLDLQMKDHILESINWRSALPWGVQLIWADHLTLFDSEPQATVHGHGILGEHRKDSQSLNPFIQHSHTNQWCIYNHFCIVLKHSFKSNFLQGIHTPPWIL